eukprot:gene5420-2968_t
MSALEDELDAALRDIDSAESDDEAPPPLEVASPAVRGNRTRGGLDFAAGQQEDPDWMAKARALERIEGMASAAHARDRKKPGQPRGYGGLGDRLLDGVGSFLFARHQNQVITAAAPPQLNGAHTVGARKNGWGEGTEELSATKHATHTCAALPCDPKHWSQFYTGKKPEKDGVTCQPKGGSSTSIMSTTTKSAAKQAIVVMSHGSMKSTVEKVIALAKAVGENDAFQSSPIDVWASIDDTQVNPSSHHPTQVLAHARTLCAPHNHNATHLFLSSLEADSNNKHIRLGQQGDKALAEEWGELYGKDKEMTAGFIAHMEVLAMWSKEPLVKMQDYRYVWLLDHALVNDKYELSKFLDTVGIIIKNINQDGQLLTGGCEEVPPATATATAGLSKRFKSYTKVKCDVRSQNTDECNHSGLYKSGFGVHRFGMTLLDEVDQCSLKYVTGVRDLSACSIAHAAELTIGQMLQ